jgi:hypothetical protein
MTFDSYPVPPARLARHRYLWLLSLPFIWQLGMVPFINDVSLRPFGLPFALAWQMAGVVLASLVFALVFELDRRAGLETEEQAFMAAVAANEGEHARQVGHA